MPSGISPNPSSKKSHKLSIFQRLFATLQFFHLLSLTSPKQDPVIAVSTTSIMAVTALSSTDTQSLQPTAIYSPLSHNLTKNSDFLRAFGNGPTNNTTFDQPQSQYASPSASMSAFNSPEDPSFFDFEPPQNGAITPFQDRFPTPGIPGWGTDIKYHPPLSPPNSAVLPSKGWSYTPVQGMPGNVLTNIQPTDTFRSQFGQVTPPDDDNRDMLSNELEDLDENVQEDGDHDSLRSKNCKRQQESSPKSTSKAQPPPKRTRKNNTRTSKNTLQDPNNPADVRRSKFLERNRVAASKCRQKKKEWTQNLETRGRDLQKHNNSLRIMIETLHEEVCSLKDQCRAHVGCKCDAIQRFTAENLQGQDAYFKEEPTSLIGSAPVSRYASVDGSLPGKPAVHEDPKARRTEHNDRALEALLKSSLEHDTDRDAFGSPLPN